MELISLASAVTLTEWSERTFWRRFADGSVKRSAENGSSGKSMVVFDSIRPHLCLPLNEDDIQLLLQADGGSAEAQAELALVFLGRRKWKGAVYWLEQAAKQNNAEAMHWLGRCYIEGNGVPKEENLGIMWLARSAAAGHPISQAQLQAMRDKLAGRG